MSSTTRCADSMASTRKQFPVDRRQPGKVLVLSQQLRLKRVHASRQSRSTLPDLLRADQPERGILGEALRIVDILVARQATIDRLPDQVGEWELCVLASRIGDVLRDQVAEAQPLVQFAHKNQAAVGSDPRSLEFDLQRRVEGELKGLVCGFIHWVSASAPSSSRANPHQ